MARKRRLLILTMVLIALLVIVPLVVYSSLNLTNLVFLTATFEGGFGGTSQYSGTMGALATSMPTVTPSS